MKPVRALLVDPSLFTPSYDAALTEGLVAAGVEPTWLVRPLRKGESHEINPGYAEPLFYRRVDGATWLSDSVRSAAKGVAHAWGLARMVRHVARRRPDVVHFQWTVLPALDALAMLLIRRYCPVVVTVHDTQAFNGEYVSFLQNLAFDLPLRVADHAIVHTRAGRESLRARGIADEKLGVIPHGPLSLRVEPPPFSAAGAPQGATPASPDAPYTLVLFGEIKHYKGADVLVEALGRLPQELRTRMRCVVAGRPRMDLRPLSSRIAELGLEAVVELRPARLTETEMAELFARADCFVFPYRQIDASGVYFLVKGTSKWLIASRVGVFAEDLDEACGELVAPEDPDALADALARAVSLQPQAHVTAPGTAWLTIGQATLEVYRRAQARRDMLETKSARPEVSR